MLNDLYGGIKILKLDQCTDENVYTMRVRGRSGDNQIVKHMDDDETVKCTNLTAISSDSACNNNTHCKAATKENFDNLMIDSMPTYTSNSPNDMKYAEVTHHQDQELNAVSKMQNNNVYDTDDASVTQPAHHASHQHAPKNQDPFPYVSLGFANNGKYLATDSDNKTSDYVQETNLAIRYI